MHDLIGRTRRGDAAAAADLILRHEARVRLYAAQVAPRPDLAEDVAQRAFVLALQHLDRFDPDRDFVLWMQGIVRNVARQEWERLARRSRIERDDLAAWIEQAAGEHAADADADAPRLEALRGCVEALAPRAREMIALRYGLGVACAEVADRVGTGVDAVKMALMRIRRTLRDCVVARVGRTP
ncbi:MAG TPA: sigma-70 family RNA polymerase sigma factor [Planctomycetota bacterium]|nr:sigma-70 family RNA polymerase sigma factor [Planctomycetota bacterium]